MTEMDNVVLTQSVEQTANRRRIAMMSLALAAGTLAAACGVSQAHEIVSHSSDPVATAPDHTPATCDSPNLSSDLADTTFAQRYSFLPNLDQSGVTPEQLVNTNEAVKLIQTQVSSDARVAGLFSEAYRLRDSRKAPDTMTLEGVQQSIAALEKNPDFAKKEVTNVCEQLQFIEPNDAFAIVGGDATQITVERDTKTGDVINIKFSTVSVDRIVKGFVLGANYVQGNLSADDVAFFKQFASDLVVTDDGTIYIRHLKVNGNISVGVPSPTSPSSTSTSETSPASASSVINNGGGQQGPNNAPNLGQGHVPEGGPGGVTSSPGRGPSTPGTTSPSTTIPSTPGTTETTATTQPPETTTTPTTAPKTTTTFNKPTTTIQGPPCTNPLIPDCH